MQLPFPDASLFPNRSKGRHFGTIQRAKEMSRANGSLLARAWKTKHGFQPDAKARYGLYVLFQVDRDNKDLDNMLAACKPLLDGVASGLGVNDKQFRPITIDVERVAKASRQCVMLSFDEWSSSRG